MTHENKPVVSLDRVRRLRMEVPAIAGIIEITSIEDPKGRGWREPRVSRIEGPYDGWQVSAREVPILAEALRNAFAEFEREFGPTSSGTDLPQMRVKEDDVEETPGKEA